KFRPRCGPGHAALAPGPIPPALRVSPPPGKSRPAQPRRPASPKNGKSHRPWAWQNGSTRPARLRPTGWRDPPGAVPAPSCPAAYRSLFQVFDLFFRLSADFLRQGRGHEGIEIAIQHVRGRTAFHPGAQILHQLIGLQDIGADLVAPADLLLFPDKGAGLGLLLFQL